jgi:hypothetical protein
MKNSKIPLLHIEYIEKYYGNAGGVTKALDQISFDIQSGIYKHYGTFWFWKNNNAQLYIYN